MRYKSIYKCPECRNGKDIHLIECPHCLHKHSYITEFVKIVGLSTSYVDCMNKINEGLSSTICRQTVRKFINSLDLNIEHFNGGRGRIHYTKEKTLVENSPANQQILKTLIERESLIPYVCAECGNSGVWNGKPLVLQLDHRNGDNKDNRIENLRYLCPNCHTQTPTYCGKKGKGAKKPRNTY